MRVVCKLARECLDEGAKVCGVGVPTDEIDRAVHEGKVDCDQLQRLGYLCSLSFPDIMTETENSREVSVLVSKINRDRDFGKAYCSY